MTIRVLLVDDHEVLLDGLSTLLAKEPEIEVVGRAKDGESAVQQAVELKPDLVVMDLQLPGISGIEATRQIRADLPDTRILCLSMHGERQFVAAAFEAGVSGYILKEQPLQTVLTGLRTIMAGGTYLCETTASTVVEDYRSFRTTGRPDSSAKLTTREREVLQLIAKGLSTSEIAERLGVSPKTVGSHRENIKDKLDIRSVAGLTKFAIRHGLTTAERHGSEK